MPAHTPLTLAHFAAVTTNSQRHEWLQANPTLLSASAVQDLCSLVSDLAAKDLRQARLAAANAFWLANKLGHLPSQALSTRALANALRLRSRLRAAKSAYHLALALFGQAGDHQQVAITKSSALLTLSFLSEFELAHRWASDARTVFEQARDTLRVARLDLNLGALYYRQERFEEALSQWTQALDTFQQLSLPNECALTLTNIATCNISLYRFEEAIAAYQSAHDLATQHNLHSTLHTTEYNIAYLYYLRGDHASALKAYAIARDRSRQASDPMTEALCDLDEAEIYLEMNLLAEADELAARAAASFSQLFVSYEEARASIISAIVASRQSRTQACLSLLERAHLLFYKEGNSRWLAMVDLYRAFALLREGRLFEARRFAERALDGLPHTKALLASLLLSRVHLELGEHNAAAELSSRASDALSEMNRPDLLFQARFLQGEAAAQCGHSKEALQNFRSGEQELERLRAAVTTSENKMGVLADKLEVYERLFVLSLETSDLRPALSVADLLAIVEKAKAQSLADLLSLTAPMLKSTSSTRSSLVDRVQQLREQLVWFHRQLDNSELSDTPPSEHRLGALLHHTSETERELTQTLASLHQSDEMHGLSSSFSRGTLRNLQELLAPTEVLIEYYIAQDIVFALVIEHNSCRAIPLAVASALQERQRQFDFQLRELTRLERPRPRSSQVISSLLRSFHEALIAPLELGESSERLIVVPHGFLYYLPFHAFLGEKQHLGLQYRLTYLPTSNDLVSLRRRLQSPSGLSTQEPEHGHADFEDSVESVASSLELRADNPIFSRVGLDGSSKSLLDLFRSSTEKPVALVGVLGDPQRRVGNGLEVVGLVRGLMTAGAQYVLLPLWPQPEDVRFLSMLRERWTGTSAVDFQVQAAYRGALETASGPVDWAPFVVYGV